MTAGRSLSLASFVPPLRGARWALVLAATVAVAAGCTAEETTSGAGGHPASSGSGGSGLVGGGGVGGGGGTLPPACDPYVPRATAPEAIIAPTGLQNTLLGLMNEAQTDLSLMMYQLTVSGLVNGLIDAHQRGVNVRVLLDYGQGANDWAISQLSNAGVPLKAAPAEFSHAHAKVMILDGSRAVVMSANMNSYSMSSERNYGIIDHDPQDISQLQAIFERDWEGQGPIDLSCSRLIVSPQNARQHIIQFIQGATQQLDLAVMYLTDNDVETAVKARASAGVPVRVLLANPEWIDSNPATAASLSAAGIETRYLYTKELHAKLIIADGVAFVGSENLSYNSLNNNRELGLLVTEPEPAALIVERFEGDWVAGTAAP